MKVRRVSPLLLLFGSSLVGAASDSPSKPQQDARLSNLRRRDAPAEILNAPRQELPTTTTRAPQQTSRPYRGTQDAPVDGLDGKPHAGPFVYPDEPREQKESDAIEAGPKAPPESLNRFTSSPDERWRVEDIPERNDGVMNDENRIAPKKGTTGTEGGISEKERERKENGYAGENRPQSPKEAPDMPHSEQSKIEEALESGRLVGKEGDKSYSRPSEKSSGGYSGLEKPENLPDKPHDIPYPDPKYTPSNSRSEPPIDSAGRGSDSSWLKDTMPYTEGQKIETTPVKLADGTTPPNLTLDDHETWHEWFHSFVLSLTMILFSEIGDKTFLVAALMAMRHSQVLVFSAAFSALVVMTVLSAVLGHAVPTLLPKRLTTLAAAILFLVFGAKMMREGLAMDKDMGVGEEMREVEAELEEKEHSMAMERSRRRSSSVINNTSPYGLESGRGRQPSIKIPKTGEPSPPLSRSPSPNHSPARRKGAAGFSGLMNLCSLVLSPAWVQTFIMTFLGEWGDRSQIATIAMAAGQDYWWVTLGAITGHACCTGVAVLGGRALAGRVSMRVVTIGGAGAFLVFGVIYLVECAAGG